MNVQPATQLQSSATGFKHRRDERDGATRSQNKVQSAKSDADGKAAELGSSSCDRLVYLTTCLVGHPVEVQLSGGSVYTGIFHAANPNDFGIVLKMARMIQDGPSQGQKPQPEFVKAHSKTLIIPSKELAQLIAKDVAATKDEFLNDLQADKQRELLTDSNISRSFHVEMGRELEPWIPDEDAPQCPELDNVFDSPWHRGWDQFETNEKLFGVKSTFNEELYTTKLERGPLMRNLEQQATRIAREIEGESTQDLHIAEERGYQLDETFDIDEETRYSSVHRGGGFDDSGCADEEDISLDARNALTFGGSLASESKKKVPTDSKNSDLARDCNLSSQSEVDLNHSIPGKQGSHLASDSKSKDLPASDSENRMENQILEVENNDNIKFAGKQKVPAEDSRLPNPGGSRLLMGGKGDGVNVGQPTKTVSSDSSRDPVKTAEKQSSGGRPRYQVSSKASDSTKLESPNTAGTAPVFSGSGLSPSSSAGSMSSEKSTLNPNAKEFKLNPNAKSFMPSHSSSRPPSPISDGSFYYPSGVSGVPHMPGFGVGLSYAGHQPVMYAPQFAPVRPSQAYFPPNGPQYGQQMLMGQSGQVVYMPPYLPEPPHGGRDNH